MDWQQLTRAQLETLLQRAESDLSYYARLQARMKVQGFPQEDKLWQLVDEAHGKLQHLRMWLHYRVDEGLKGMTPREGP
jgi:hypothetical protein